MIEISCPLYINERWLNSLDKNEIAVDELNKGIQIAIKKAISPYQNQFMNGLIVSTGTSGYRAAAQAQRLQLTAICFF